MTSDQGTPSSAEGIEGRIIDFIERELLDGEATVGRQDNLLSGEFFDSIGVLRLATFIEEEFQITIQPVDYIVENFENVALLASYVVRSVSESGASADGYGEQGFDGG